MRPKRASLFVSRHLCCFHFFFLFLLSSLPPFLPAFLRSLVSESRYWGKSEQDRSDWSGRKKRKTKWLLHQAVSHREDRKEGEQRSSVGNRKKRKNGSQQARKKERKNMKEGVAEVHSKVRGTNRKTEKGAREEEERNVLVPSFSFLSLNN
mmetsp:Transcript_46326/g.91333  ORF Transcript_46326/g.91333 Transcript_46326/m.91333 type:complete len:151 (-) Transcript_46326:1328-1780(-)